MACRDGMPEELEGGAPDPSHVTKNDLEAMLCGMVKAFGFDHVVAMVDWNKAGVTEQQFRDWWKEHRKRDQAREAAE